jgi:YggT family protein
VRTLSAHTPHTQNLWLMDSFSQGMGRQEENPLHTPYPLPSTPYLPMTANNIQIIAISLSILLALGIFLFIFRIVLTWYPQVESQKFPFSLVIAPTEPFLAPARKVIPPIGGVDITPIVWVAILSLIREVLVGQQGIITMLTH